MPDISFFVPLFVQSALVPFGVALAVLVVARIAQPGAIGPALAVAAGFLGTYFAALHAQWSPLPKLALDWLPWIAVAGTAGAVLAERIGRAGLRIVARLALALAAGAVVVWPALAGLGLPQALLIAAVTGSVVCTVWSALAQAAASRPTPPWLLAVVAGGAGVALMLDSSQSLGQLSGGLAAALAACALLGLRRSAFSPAAAGSAVLLLGALLANAYVYAGFPLAYIALLVAGLLADPAVAALNRLRKRRGGAGSFAVATVLTALPAAVAIGLAVQAAAESGGY